jgi:hypothetical protein
MRKHLGMLRSKALKHDIDTIMPATLHNASAALGFPHCGKGTDMPC